MGVASFCCNALHAASLLIVLSLVLPLAHANVVINEMMSSNTATILDENGDPSDWFELYNNGTSPIDLTGYYATDTAAKPTQWRFPNVTMQPNGFLLVWASGKDRTDPSGPLHTNFSIKAAGEPIILKAPDGTTTVDSFPSVALANDQSYGRPTDGGGPLGILAAASPNATNANATPPLPPLALSFSRDAGFVNSAFTLTIATNHPNATVYYTIDGSIPTANSTPYTGPLNVTNRSGEPNGMSMFANVTPNFRAPIGETQKATVVRAFAIDGNQSTGVRTATYLVDVSFPVAVVSVTTDNASLFDYETGLYVKGKAWDDAEAAGWQGPPTFHPANYEFDNDSWERTAHFEMFETNGTRVIDQDMGVQISGQGSRSRQQKSMRFYARGSYGKSSVSYQVFPDQNLTTYKRLGLRNGDGDGRTTFLRDVIVHTAIHNGPVAGEDARPAVLFLNGEYWGLYPIREHANQHYVEEHYGIPSDDVIVVEDNAALSQGNPGEEVPYANLVTFASTHDLSDPANFAIVQSQMDTQNFADYYALETYIANTDWPSRNVKLWRDRANTTNGTYGQDGKWRWLLHDADYALGYVAAQGPSYDMFNHIQQTTWGGALWRALARNEQFRDQFVWSTEDQMRTELDSNNLLAITDSWANAIAPLVPQEIARYPILQNVTQWNANVNTIRNFINARPAYHRQHLARYFGLGGTAILTVNGDDARGTVQVNTINITTSSAAAYFQDVPVRLTAYPKPGKVFLGWNGAASSTSPTISIVLAGDTTIGAVFADAPDVVPAGASLWVTRKSPATYLSVNEGQNVTLAISLSGAATSVSWAIDGVLVDGSDLSLPYMAAPGSAGNHTINVTVSDGTTTLHQGWILRVLPVSGQLCASYVWDLPVTCTGGTVTQDTNGSCRTVVCSNGTSFMKASACGKPTSANPQYFEMYKQGQNGTQVTSLCLGPACLTSNGFAQASFPACVTVVVQRDIAFASLTPPGANATILLNGTLAFNYTLSNPAGLPTGSLWTIDGDIIPFQEDLLSYDYAAGSVGAFNLTVNVSSNETSIAHTWLVVVPNATGDASNGTNGTNTTGNQTNVTTVCAASVSALAATCTGGNITQDAIGGCRTVTCIGIAGSLQVLACDKPGSLNPQFFEMYRQPSSSGSGVNICLGGVCIGGNGYVKSANYPVCFNMTVNSTGNQTNGTNSTNSTNVSLNISFTSVSPNGADVIITEPASKQFSYVLGNLGSLPTLATWYLNGTNQTPVFNLTSYTFPGGYGTNGSYNVTVVVDSNQSSIAQTWILTVLPFVNTTNATNTTNTTNATASLQIAPWFPQGHNYIFVCNATGFTPTSYDFVFGDGHKQIGYNQNNVWHTYVNAGSYNVTCTARDTSLSAAGALAITVA